MATKKSLQAAAATSGMFTAAKEEPKQAKPKKETRQQATPEPKRTKETFSVKIDSEVLKKWRVYTSIDGYGDKGRLTEAAISEYMNRHKLTGAKLKKFETLTSID